jgi:hypothetical protein
LATSWRIRPEIIASAMTPGPMNTIFLLSNNSCLQNQEK